MFLKTAWTTLWTLLFRAGPQDFPASPLPLRGLVPLAALANFLVFRSVSANLATALVLAVIAVGALALVTHVLLRNRNLLSRFPQTLDALLATSSVLSLLMLPALHAVAPTFLELAKNPDLLQQKPDLLPAGPVWALNALNFWNFAVTAHIFRNAAGVNLWLGLLIALVATLAVLFLMLLAGTVVAVFVH